MATGYEAGMYRDLSIITQEQRAQTGYLKEMADAMESVAQSLSELVESVNSRDEEDPLVRVATALEAMRPPLVEGSALDKLIAAERAGRSSVHVTPPMREQSSWQVTPEERS